MSDNGYSYHMGTGPLLVSMPHVGTDIPDDIACQLIPDALSVPDTDWYLDILYDFLKDIKATIIRPGYSRYVVDLNRSSEGGILYPGQSETSICPQDGFDGKAIYRDGNGPAKAEIDRRLQCYWHPYHDKIATELDRIHAKYGYALLWDAHSIKSHVPRFFEGRLPDLNLGTGDGLTCDAGLADELLAIACEDGNYTAALNGRFKGGYITRHYGRPENNIHSFQLEISQTIYMNEEAPYEFCEEKAEKLRPILRKMTDAFSKFNPLDHT